MKALPLCKHAAKGRLVTFCGLDGSGKTTMIQQLLTYLQCKGKRVFLTKQPTDFIRNSAIFRNFQDSPTHEGYDYLSLSLLAAADRVQHVSQVIIPQLDQVDYVISDRYIYSCMANLHARGYKKDLWLYDISSYIIQPDLAFFIDVPVPQAIKRVRDRENEKDRYIDPAFQQMLRDEYIQMASWSGGCMIDGTQMIRDEFAQIVHNIEKIDSKQV